MVVQIQYCVDGTGYNNTIRIKNVLKSICNSWSVFREGGTNFSPVGN